MSNKQKATKQMQQNTNILKKTLEEFPEDRSSADFMLRVYGLLQMCND